VQRALVATEKNSKFAYAARSACLAASASTAARFLADLVLGPGRSCGVLTGFVGAGLQTPGGAALRWWLVGVQRHNADPQVFYRHPVVSGLAWRYRVDFISDGVLSMNKDQITGATKEAAGKVQEAAGKLVGSKEQEAKGLVKQVEGNAQQTYGDAKEIIKDATK